MGDFDTVSTFSQGFLLGGRYEIRRVIGQGGMGVVYLAVDKQLEDEPRAIKTIKPELLHSPKAARQLKKEAISSIKLTHTNIVRILNYEEWQGNAYIVMEYIEGKTLEELLAEKERLAEAEFLEIARQICGALKYAHEEGIIHQDIKPANIFINNRGVVKLADFGIARIAKDTTTRMTGQMPSGTIAYMSPELLRGKKPSVASDIYSLGITFYEMLSGDPPFVRGDIYRQHQEEEPAPIEGIPPALNNAIQQTLTKAQADRPPSVSEVWSFINESDASPVVTTVESPVKDKDPEIFVPADLPEEITNSIGMKLRLIPAGSFLMGAVPGDKEAHRDEKPQHEVEITKPLYLGVYPVTQEQYEAVMGRNPSKFKTFFRKNPKLPNLPVERVSWKNAKEFCRKLSEKEGVTYRLPTEAEWEYACRAGTTTKYYWGDNAGNAGNYAWYSSNSDGKTHEVGRKQPNAWGLYDMSGNVWEWCEDWYDEDYYSSSPRQDPQGPSSGQCRVLRGGGWGGDVRLVRSSLRVWYRPVLRYDNLGFRIVREVE